MILDFRFKDFKIYKGVLMICLCFASFSYAQVSTEIDTTIIRIGEQINYKIKVKADSSSLVIFPEGQTFLPLEAVEASKVDTSKTDKKLTLSRLYKLTQFDSGSYTIPRQKIIINEKPFFTDSLKVEVNTITIDTTKQKLYDIKPMIEVDKSSNSSWLLYILIALLAIALIGFLLFWFVWRKKPLTEEEEIALLPPYDRAKIALQKLENSDYLQRSEIKDYYSELTDIIRRYLDEKVYDKALESTTSELIDRLQLLTDGNQIKLKGETISNLQSILQRADLVKFAKSAPDIALAELDKSTIEKELDNVKVSLPEPTEEEKLLDKQYKEEQERKKKHRKVVLTIGISLFLISAIFIGFGLKYGFTNVKDTLLGNDNKELLEGEWVSSAYGFPPIYIETPEVLERQNYELPEELEGKAKVSVFTYGSLQGGLYIVTSTTQLQKTETEDAEEQKKINIEGVVEQSLKSWEAQGVKNIITKNDQFITPNAAAGLKTYGKAKFPTLTPNTFNDGEYAIYSFTTETVIQQIVIKWQPDENYTKDIIDRIVNSIELNPDEEEEEN